MTTTAAFARNEKKTKFNRTPKKNKPKGRSSQPHKKAVVKSPLPVVNEYLCKVCDNLVEKKNPCGKELSAASKGQPAKTAGLGRFKCTCGSKTVYVKKLKPASVADIQKAA